MKMLLGSVLTTGHNVIHAAVIQDRFKTGNWKKKRKENERKRTRERKVLGMQDTDLWGSCSTKDREILLSK